MFTIPSQVSMLYNINIKLLPHMYTCMNYFDMSLNYNTPPCSLMIRENLFIITCVRYMKCA